MNRPAGASRSRLRPLCLNGLAVASAAIALSVAAGPPAVWPFAIASLAVPGLLAGLAGRGAAAGALLLLLEGAGLSALALGAEAGPLGGLLLIGLLWLAPLLAVSWLALYERGDGAPR